ncbi:MAG TPA: hypothetical protein VFU46_00600 [Gemmatimonadales bacterium]|nr:hypothetical protein [Gemmatimonadales bacterium]
MYVDPQAGSILFQVAAAALLGALGTVRRWWAHAAGAVSALVARLRR